MPTSSETSRNLPAPIAPPPAPFLRVEASPLPFHSTRVSLTLPAAGTIRQIVRVVVKHSGSVGAHCWIGQDYVPREVWHLVRPKPGVTVTINAVPSGNRKGVLTAFLALAIVAAAIVTGGAAAAALGFQGVTILGTTFTGAQIIGAGLAIAGSLALNALIAPSAPRVGGGVREPLVPLLTGFSNQFLPLGEIPKIHGRRRVFPPFAATQVSEQVGSDRFIRALFCVGHGPLDLSEFKIGNTPVAQFDDFEMEWRSGRPGEPPLTLFTDDIAEDGLSITLREEDGFTERVAPQDADELSVDVTFPTGLFFSDKRGKPRGLEIAFQVEFKPVSGGAWQRVQTVRFSDNTSKRFAKGVRWKVATGLYKVRIRRVTEDFDQDNVFDQMIWTAFRGIRHIDPVARDDVALIAIRMKETDQLNGRLDQLNCVAESFYQVWDGAQWVEQKSRLPAWAYVEALTGSANQRALDFVRVAKDDFKAWADRSAAEGRSFDAVFENERPLFQVLDDIAAAGRARRTMNDDLFSIVEDLPQSTPVQLFTPHNSKNFRWEKGYTERPHGIKARFVNEDIGWDEDERTIFADGFDENNATKLQSMTMFGYTDPDHVFKDVRYHIAANDLRPRTILWDTDIEFMRCRRGDLVSVAHDAILVGLGSGRIKGVLLNGGNDVVSITLDNHVTMEAGKTYAVLVRLDDSAMRLQDVITAVGETDTLSFATPIPVAEKQPVTGDLVTFGESGLVTIDVVIKDILPRPNFEATIMALDAAPAIHNSVGTIPPFVSGATPRRDPSAPVIVDVRSDESVLIPRADGSLEPQIVVEFSIDEGNGPTVAQVQYRWRRSEGTEWNRPGPLPPNIGEISIQPVEQGAAYDIRVRTLSRDGSRFSNWVPVDAHVVGGQSADPADVDMIFLEGSEARWTYDPPIDFDGFQVRSRAGNNPAWEDATPEHTGLLSDGRFDISGLPPGPRTLMIKAFDRGGRESKNPGALRLNIGDAILDNFVFTRDFVAEGFPGEIINGSIVDGNMQADAAGDFWLSENTPFWSDNLSDPWWTTTFDEMTYTVGFAPERSEIPARLTLNISAEGNPFEILYNAGSSESFWREDNEPFWIDATEPFWSVNDEFRPWPGAITARRKMYRFRVRTAKGTRGKISTFGIVLDVEDELEHFDDLLISAAGLRLPLTKAFRQIVNIQATLQDDGGTAETVRVADKDPINGPLIFCFDDANMKTSGIADIDIQGVKG